jgi:hypothetical protein
MKALRARSYVLDLVHLDAFKIAPQGPGAGEAMYAAYLHWSGLATGLIPCVAGCGLA